MTIPSVLFRFRTMLARIEVLRFLYAWISQVADPLKALTFARGLDWYFRDWRQYSRLPSAETISLMDTQPALLDRTTGSPTGGHYFFVGSWAARRILASASTTMHVDLGSLNLFVGALSAAVRLVFLDYRPLSVRLNGLSCARGTILELPFASGSIKSLSCLHVAEHIGLGRYGEPLDPLGTWKAAQELARVLQSGGNLYFALPVGRPRLCFNAHRIHAAEAIPEYFAGLELVEFSGTHDDGRFVERVSLSEFRNSRYACGMFWFRKG